ncbi:MAG: ATP-binding protein [Gemmatimonadaceae bacterium]|nr:ATP-binding protein [Gemmatimonadaceae bacterium]
MTVPDALATAQAVPTPAWYPAWARDLAGAYFAGSASLFVLHGNTFDDVQLDDGAAPPYGPLATFLAEQLFGSWDLVLHYDVGRGVRPYAGRNPDRLREMSPRTTEIFGNNLEKSRVVEPQAVFAALDRYLIQQLHSPAETRRKVALIIDHASFAFPAAEAGSLTLGASSAAVTALNWAAAASVRRIDFACVLIEERRANLQGRISQNPHVVTLDVPLPSLEERARYIEALVGTRTDIFEAGLTATHYARETAGLALNDIAPPLRAALDGQARLDQAAFKKLKKGLIERQCHGLLEFVEPKFTLDDVVGLDAAKRTLREDAKLLQAGRRSLAPMGYLICGPVGTGKTFLVMAAAGEMGMPCVTLKNFRSKYVGETEANLEHVLSVLRAMGPVMVIIDEADAMLGDRESEGDGGVSSRVFGMIAHQMGNTAYRGQIVWVLMTARPDLLPIDLKRQGRAEVHIPLFYPDSADELRLMLKVMAKKVGVPLESDATGPDLAVPHVGQLSGADIEGVITRAARQAGIAGESAISRVRLETALADFIPSAQSLEKRLQVAAAILECTDSAFLPAALRGSDRAALQAEMARIKAALR